MRDLRYWIGIGALVSGLSFGAASVPALAAGTNFVFVSNERSNNIMVIDPAQDYAIIRTIATAGRPRDMSFNSDHSLLYVACGDDDVIDVIDMETLEVVDSIPTGRSPEMFKLSHDDSLIYVSNEESSTVQIIDVAGKIIVNEISTGAEPEGIALNEDGTILYATSEVADMVHVIDAADAVVIENILVGTRPRRFIQPSPDEIWVSDELSGTVSVIDLTSYEVSNTLEFLPPGFRQVDVTPVGMTMTSDGAIAVVTLGRANHVAFVNTATKEIEDYVLVGSRAWGVDISADDSTAFVANGLSDDLSIIDVASRRNVRTFPVGRIPHTVIIDD